MGKFHDHLHGLSDGHHADGCGTQQILHGGNEALGATLLLVRSLADDRAQLNRHIGGRCAGDPHDGESVQASQVGLKKGDKPCLVIQSPCPKSKGFFHAVAAAIKTAESRKLMTFKPVASSMAV